MLAPPKAELDSRTDEMLATPPDISNLITEDDTPVDNLFSEKQMRLLAESLYTSWAGPGDGRPFVAMANVGLFYTTRAPALVPDVLLSLDVRAPDAPEIKERRSYFIWEYGKPPDVIVEIVSNRKGGELGDKLLDYARLGVAYYVVHDPYHYLSERPLRIFTRLATGYTEVTDTWLAGVGLGLTLWEGEYEEATAIWLRWCTQDGTVLATGAEAAATAKLQAEEAEQRAEEAEQRAQTAEERATALVAKLRSLGVDPDA